MKVLVFFGPPGAGKGTQASRLAKEGSSLHLSTGSLLRDEIALNSPLGLKVKEIMDSGALVGDSVLFEVLEASLQRVLRTAGLDCLVLDGVPRTVNQIQMLDDCLYRSQHKVDAVVHFVAPLEKIVHRFASRLTCKECKAVFSVSDQSNPLNLICSSCGAKGSLFRRADDAPEAVSKRFSVYEQQTLPILKIYSSRGIVHEVDGLECEEVVAKRVQETLLKLSTVG